MFEAPEQPRLTNDDYSVGWICALEIELAASQAMLDEIHPNIPLEPGDSNTYTLGRMGQHCHANNLLRSFHNIRFGLMVGVGGGAPSLPNDDPYEDVRLGDVVVSTPQGGHGGVIQYDFGKTVIEGSFVQTGALNKPPSVLRAGVSKIKANHMRGSRKMISYIAKGLKLNPGMTDFGYPGERYDQLFEADYDHVNKRSGCNECDQTRSHHRQSRMTNDPVIHYGLIGSANQAMRHSLTREKLRQQNKILCFETEAAGLMESFPCIIVRGICHYSDTHENKRWQPYAAMTAAGYAKELLSCIPSLTMKFTAEAAKIMSMVHAELAPIHEKLKTLQDDMMREKIRNILNWLAPPSYEAQYIDALYKRQEGTGKLFLDSPHFAAWVRGDIRILLCPGIPGAGKTIMASIVIHYMRVNPQNKQPFLPHEQLEIRASEADIIAYVSGELGYFSECVQKSLKLQDIIKRTVANFSGGMFLLATLYTKSLRSKRTEGYIDDALKFLSQEQKNVVQTINRVQIERIERQSEDDREWARRLLTWVYHAKRTLSPTELQHALAIQIDSREFQRKYLPPIEELVSLCAGLVSFDKKSDHVQFAYWTALRYFDSDELPGWVHTAPAEISRTCLTYLAFDVFAAGRAPNDQAFEQRMEENSDIQNVAGLFLQNETLVNCASQVIFAGPRDQEGYSQRTLQTTGIHLTAWFGLELLMSDLLVTDPRRANLLDPYDQAPLHLSSRRGFVETVELLLRHDVDINARDKDGRTALHEASEMGHSTVVQILLENKADASVKDRCGWTALRKASSHGHDEVTRQLTSYN
ncbi:purine and uridine phosphorylase [Aspergillus affinis]|uniref:purine and uridine phosphorylase n=1 Tax=Aspergillus affinis TaxID=1070780 RepID=UPI0022FDE199|nr:purine and uridine phosphorylase [Aspergillus affinis]KAI9045415.1 purine and uridine phosphorylase [Aspergillus affinis]